MFSQCLLLEPSHFTTWVKQKVPQTYPFNLSNQVYTVSTQSLLTKPINYKNKNILQLVITIQTNPSLPHVLKKMKMDIRYIMILTYTPLTLFKTIDLPM
jgi:hypothetical protein